MKPDLERAATAATETLIRFGVRTAPVSVLPILEQMPGVLVVSFETMSRELEMDRRCVISAVCDKKQDAVTSVNIVDSKPQYIVAYNQLLSVNLAQRALARELAHIVLGHDGSTPDDVASEEAKTFAHHLVCPRPLIHAIQAAGIRLTVEVLGNVTGCYDYCLSCMRRQPVVHVPAALNRAVRDNFRDYVVNFFEFHRHAAPKDVSALADFGTYLEGYEE